MPFLGGLYCFPGGTLHKDDSAEAMQRRCRGLTPIQARATLGAHFSPREAMGLWVATARELFEETGVLLACRETAALITATDRLHETSMAQSLSFLELLEREQLQLDLSALGYFSCWQTPSQFPVRFDTRFFIAMLPEGQVPLATSAEVAHSVWLTPDRALQLFAKNDLPMIFPTFASLRALADFTTLESVRREYFKRG